MKIAQCKICWHRDDDGACQCPGSPTETIIVPDTFSCVYYSFTEPPPKQKAADDLARDMLERAGIDDAQSLDAASLAEVAKLINDNVAAKDKIKALESELDTAKVELGVMAEVRKLVIGKPAKKMRRR